MEKYKVTVKCQTTKIIEVDADNEQEAERIVLNNSFLFPKNTIILSTYTTLSDLGRKPIPKYAKVFSIEEFNEESDAGNYMDEDGYGYLAWDNEMSDIDCFDCGDSELVKKYGFTKVVWFNK